MVHISKVVFILIVLFSDCLVNAGQNASLTPPLSSHDTTFLVVPGVVPPLIGYFNFDTKHHVSYSLNSFFPDTTRTISVTVFISTGFCGSSVSTSFNVWLWTECWA
ncbi:unnamed protein product, partial [Rotaria magnacalcarata]